MELVRELCEAVSTWPEVTAIALGGSRAIGGADAGADIDLYVYAQKAPAPECRRKLFAPRATRLELDNRVWETGDEWTDRSTGIDVDLMYRSPQWIEDALSRVLDDHQSSVGYTTCLWHNVKTSHIRFDRCGWYTGLHAKAQCAYPPPLAAAIIAKNYPLLRRAHSSFQAQILKAVDRKDIISINHRIAAFFASYFDVLFALNRVPHPGEKRLLRHASQLPFSPASLTQDVNQILLAGAACQREPLQSLTNSLIDGLESLLSASKHGHA